MRTIAVLRYGALGRGLAEPSVGGGSAGGQLAGHGRLVC
jgi:hypothetical protein